MPNDNIRTKSGNMSPELQAKVDALLEEFMAVVDAMTESRHLQKGIARSQLPRSMVVVLDKATLSILAQIRSENRFASYFYNPNITLTPQRAVNSAQWEFGLDDPYIIQFPGSMLDQSTEQRHSGLEKIAAEHIDSEFERFVGLLSLMRTRPIFGQATLAVDAKSVFLLMPQDEALKKSGEAILEAIQARDLAANEAGDIRNGKSAVHEMWFSINRAAIVIADLTGADAGVMYGLGIAHTLGKETILIYPQGSRYLRDIPRTHRIEYEYSNAGMTRLKEQLSEMLQSMLQPVAGD